MFNITPEILAEFKSVCKKRINLEFANDEVAEKELQAFLGLIDAARRAPTKKMEPEAI